MGNHTKVRKRLAAGALGGVLLLSAGTAVPALALDNPVSEQPGIEPEPITDPAPPAPVDPPSGTPTEPPAGPTNPVAPTDPPSQTPPPSAPPSTAPEQTQIAQPPTIPAVPEEPRFDRGTGYAIDPASGYLIHPDTGWLIEPGTGNLINPASWFYTGYRWDPATRLVSEPGDEEPDEAPSDEATSSPSPEPTASTSPSAAPEASTEPSPTPKPAETVEAAVASSTDGGGSLGTSGWVRGGVAVLLIAAALAYYARFRAPNPVTGS